jgi:hypothetical protein
VFSKAVHANLAGVIRCHAVCHGNSTHLSQIHTGLALLHHSGQIVLSQECKTMSRPDPGKPHHLRDARQTHLLVIVNLKARLYFDCHDSGEIDEAAAAGIDCYFKRSYKRQLVPDPLKDKVFPLGLNYELHSPASDAFSRERTAVFGRKFIGSGPRFRPTLEKMHCEPADVVPRVLFITRAWDPFDDAERPPDKITDRISLNSTRARCIKLLRREFGESFLGGFVHTDFAMSNFKGELLPDNAVSAKQNYVRLLREYPICVATTGLHGSIGWKMAEYVAFSRAIVSERLNYEAPGDFGAPANYLEFNDPEACVTAVRRLFSDAALRYRMMESNRLYYLTYLKPDRLVGRCLDIGFSRIEAGNQMSGCQA